MKKLSRLVKIAGELDRLGFSDLANKVDLEIKKQAEEDIKERPSDNHRDLVEAFMDHIDEILAKAPTLEHANIVLVADFVVRHLKPMLDKMMSPDYSNSYHSVFKAAREAIVLTLNHRTKKSEDELLNAVEPSLKKRFPEI